jgi:hypothetical protein
MKKFSSNGFTEELAWPLYFQKIEWRIMTGVKWLRRLYCLAQSEEQFFYSAKSIILISKLVKSQVWQNEILAPICFRPASLKMMGAEQIHRHPPNHRLSEGKLIFDQREERCRGCE